MISILMLCPLGLRGQPPLGHRGSGAALWSQGGNSPVPWAYAVWACGNATAPQAFEQPCWSPSHSQSYSSLFLKNRGL